MSREKQPKEKAQTDSEQAGQAEQADLITRDDIASKFHELRESMPFLSDETGGSSDQSMKVAAAAVGLAAAYFFGWRRGRRNKTVVEVRRI